MAAACAGGGQPSQQPGAIADTVGVVHQQQAVGLRFSDIAERVGRHGLQAQQGGQLAGPISHDDHLHSGAAGGRTDGGQGGSAARAGWSQHQGVLAVVKHEAGRLEGEVADGETDVDEPILDTRAAGQVVQGEFLGQRADAGRAAGCRCGGSRQSLRGCGQVARGGAGDMHLQAVADSDGPAGDQVRGRLPQPEAQSVAGVGGGVDEHRSRGRGEVGREVGGAADADRHSNSHGRAVAPDAGEPVVGLRVSHRIVSPAQAGQVVHQQHHIDRATRARGPPGGYLIVEEAQQAGPPIPVSRRDHRTDMRQPLQRRQNPGIEIDRVHVHLVWRAGPAEVESDRGQGGGRARPRTSDHHQMTVGKTPSARELPLTDRVVHQPGRGLAPGCDLGEGLGGDLGGQGCGPRRAGRTASEAPMGRSYRAHHRVEVAALVAGGPGRPRPGGSDPQARPAWRCSAGHQRRLERNQLARPESGQRLARPLPGDAGRGGRVDHVIGVVAVRHPQGDPARCVGSDVVGHHPGRALGGQHHVDTETAAPLGDPDQRAEELGQFGGQRGELVHHDHQPGQRLAARAGSGPEGGEVLGPRGPQPLLTMAELCLQTHQRPLSQAVVEVGDHPGHMGHLRAAVEGGAALVVDEDEGQMVRIRRQRQPGHHRPQQLRLARTGGAPDQQMGAVGHQVEHQGSFGGRADRHAQVRRAPGCDPAPLHRLGGRLAVQEVHKRHRVGKVGTAGAQLGVVQSGQARRGTGGRGDGDAPPHQRRHHRR